MQGRKSLYHFSGDQTLLEDILLNVEEWRKKCAVSLVNRNMEEYHTQKNQVISCLLEWRRQILSNKNTDAQQFARSLIESRKQLDKSFSIPKTPGNVPISDLPLPDLLNLHRTMQDRLIQGSCIPCNVVEQYQFEEQHGLREIEKYDQNSQQLHLFLDMVASQMKTQYPFKFYFSIWKRDVGFITDEFFVSLTENGFPSDYNLVSRLSTIFTDLLRENESIDNLYVVCRVYAYDSTRTISTSHSCHRMASIGQDLTQARSQMKRGMSMNDIDPASKDVPVRRPFGCGVVSLAKLGLSNQSGRCVITKVNMPIYCIRNSQNKDFAKLHELIVKSSNEIQLEPNPHAITLYISSPSGDIHLLQDPDSSLPSISNPTFNFDLGVGVTYDLKKQIVDSTLTPRYTQPDVLIDHRDARDEIYVTLCHGMFSQGDKSTERNIQIIAKLYSNEGKLIPNCIFKGTGKQVATSVGSTSTSSFISSVFYHQNEPSFEETFRINLTHIPSDLNWHLLILVTHCSSGQTSAMGQFKTAIRRNKKEGPVFGYAFLPLKDPNIGTIIGNGDHFISCYSMDTHEHQLLPSSLLADHDIQPFYLTDSSRKPRPLNTNSFEHLKLRIYVSSKKFTIHQEFQELFHWKDCTDAELNLAILKCVNSDLLSDDLLTSILVTSIEIISMKAILRLPAYQLFLQVLIQFREIKRASASALGPGSGSGLASGSGSGRGRRGSLGEGVVRIQGGGTEQELQDLIHEIKKWIEKYFQQDPQLPFVLLNCLWESLQTIESVLPSAPSTSVFRKNIFRTAPMILTLALEYQQQSSSVAGNAIPSQFDDKLCSILQQLSRLQPSDPDLSSLHQYIFPETYFISLGYLTSTHTDDDCNRSISNDKLMSTVAINYFQTLHSISTRDHTAAVKQDLYSFLLQFLNSDFFKTSIVCREMTMGHVTSILQNQFLSQKTSSSSDHETYTVLLTLLEGLDLNEDKNIIGHLSKLLPSFIVAVVKLLGGSCVNEGKSDEALASSMSSSSSLILEDAVCCLCSMLRLIGKERFHQLLDMRQQDTLSSEATEGGDEETKNERDEEKEDSVNADDGTVQKILLDGKNLLLALNVLFTIFLKRDVFPSAWVVLKMSYFNQISEYLSWVSEYLDSNKEVLLSSSELSRYWFSYFIFPSLEIELNIDPFHSSVSVDMETHAPVNNLILWSSLFNLSLYLLLDPNISIDTSDTKSSTPASLRAYLSENYSTFRDPIKSSLLTCWNSIGFTTLKLKFIHIFTIPILALTCSPEPTLSSVGSILLIDLLCCDYSQTQQFKLTSPHIYDCVCISVLDMSHSGFNISDRYIPSRETISEFLRDGLLKLFQQSEILNQQSAASNFAFEMKTLLILLLNLSEYPQTLEYEEERSFAYHKLMSFFKNIGRMESYVKTLHNLTREMIKLENFMEGGKLILLHIQLLDWSEEMLEPIDLGGDESTVTGVTTGAAAAGGAGVDVGTGRATATGVVLSSGLGILHAEKSYQRKITLIQYAIEIFDKGKAFEECIDLLSELCEFYRLIQPNYVKLTAVMSQQMDYYLKITTVDRFYPNMFRVGYYGAGIANELIRNKEFIYKGAPLESIIDFSNRIKKKFPHCEIISPKIRPNEEHFNSLEKGYLQISKVTHHHHGTDSTDAQVTSTGKRDGSSRFLNYFDPPSYVKNYLENQNLQYFYYQKPFRKREVKSSNEFLDLWVETIILKSEFPFPSISRRALVVSSESIVLNPIEMATQGLIERNKELRMRNIEMCSIADGQAGQSYTMTLSGTVDAAVNGGLSNYQTFIDGTYRKENPEIVSDVESTPVKQQVIKQLVSCLYEQLQLLEEGMRLHQRKCLVEMRPLHAHLLERFQVMKKNLNELLALQQP